MGDEYICRLSSAALPKAAKPLQPGLRPVGNAPLLVLRTTSPGGGSLLSVHPSANLSSTKRRTAITSPSGGSTAAGGDRGAFHSPVRAVGLLSLRPSGRLYGFIKNVAASD